MRWFSLLCLVLSLPTMAHAQGKDGNRLRYLDGNDPYYPNKDFPKLTTPQWVGEKDVEAVVILAIDDMRDPKKYEAFLRPILNRLKKIDGRAPVSIMTNQINPQEPHLQKWLKEGLSLEVHTFDHPCPYFKSGSLEKAKETYDKCVDLMATIPGSKPVAFRMPCCDSLNTPSPRHWAEIFNKTTKKGNFLTIDSSVFMLFTANDPDLPRELVLMPDGSERFRKYLPKDRTFVNTIEDYPYPYVIDRLCWQFPCMVPSDWEAQHLQKPNNPATVADWKAALDATVIKQGTMTMVFHPHGWIKADQLVDLIDYADRKYGKKVQFLNFKEAQERIDKNLLKGHPIRHSKAGMDNGVRILDLNNDGYLDVIISNDLTKQTHLWKPKERCWKSVDFPVQISTVVDPNRLCFTYEARFCFLHSHQFPSFMWVNRFYNFDGRKWTRDQKWEKGLGNKDYPLLYTTGELGGDAGVRFIDFDRDGRCEFLGQASDIPGMIFRWSKGKNQWVQLPFLLPKNAKLTDGFNGDCGLRFIDLNEDGHLDVVFSNEKEFGIYLFKDMKTGWSQKVLAGKRGDKDALPMISKNGTNNGFWVHSRGLWWANESTPLLKDHVDRRSFNELLKNVDPAPKSPEASLKSIQVRPGFKVELMAAEPLVMDPIAFSWGPDGKLWVVEMGDYPLGIDGKGKHGGKVKFLEDTDGDGKYDKSTVFLANLGFPTGVLPWGKGVLVTCAPDIFYAEDTDGDGKADKKDILYTGFNEGNQQHRLNGLVWGLDNWIYVANGDSGGNVKSIKTGKVVNISGRDVRIKPDTGEGEAVTGQTQFGRSRDDWGNWFGNNNSHPMYHFVLEDHYLRRNPHFAPPSPKVEISVAPGNAPIFPISPAMPRFNDYHTLNRFTSANSAMFYRDDLFGESWQSSRFVSEPVHNLIQREVVRANGVTFRSERSADEQDREFLASSDNWFRPTMLQTGPDGALWMADMYRHVIEHPQWIPQDWQKKLDLRAGHDKGRIYRIVPVGKKPRTIPRLDKLNLEGLVAALDSPSGWQRDVVQMMLVRGQNKEAIPLLAKLFKTSTRPGTRLQALCTLSGLAGLDEEIILHGLNDPHPGLRRHAIRFCEGNRSEAIAKAMFALIADVDPQVQMQLAYSLGEMKSPAAAVVLAKLALRHQGDPYLTAAVLSSINRKNLEPILVNVLKVHKRKSVPTSLVDNLMQMAQRQGNNAVLATLLESVAQPENGQYADWQMSALASLLDVLDQRYQSLATLARTNNNKLKPALEKLPFLFAHARQIAKKETSSLDKRLLAMRLLGRGLDKRQEDIALLGKYLAPQNPLPIQQGAALALGNLGHENVPATLLGPWKSYSPALRAQILDGLLRRTDFAVKVLEALEKGNILLPEVDIARQQRFLQHPSRLVRERAQKIFSQSTVGDRGNLLKSYAKCLQTPGDASKGKVVFEKNCSTCHKLAGIGKEVGPDLASLSGKSPELLLIAILDPNQAVEAKYVSYTALTKNGLSYAGLLSSETSTSITLIAPDGKQHDLLRSDLEELFSSGKSVMPEGLEKDISPEQMADLLAFLRGNLPQLQRKTFPGNQPKVIVADKEGNLTLPVSAAEVYGPSLILEEKYGNLGFWSSPDDLTVWTLRVPKAGKYEVTFDYACHNNTAGNLFLLECGFDRLQGKVHGTGTWDEYQQRQMGILQLQEGEQRLTMRSLGPIRNALIDLKSIRLVPAK